MEVRLTDFGLAKSEASSSSTSHAGNASIGTYSYMAPERMQGEVDKKNRKPDIFSYGIVLATLLTGEQAVPAGVGVPAITTHMCAGNRPDLSGCGGRGETGADTVFPGLVRLIEVAWNGDAARHPLPRCPAKRSPCG